MPARLRRSAVALAARSGPTWASTRSFGAKRAASCSQFQTSDFGTTTIEGRPFRCGRPASIASTWIVLPRPMSSARHPPNPNWRKKDSQPRPASWYGRSSPRNVRGACAARTPVNSRSSIARLGELRVDRDLGLRREQRIQQARLRPPEAEAVSLDRAHLGQRRILLQPLLGQHAEGAVAEADHGVASPQRPQQLGQRRRDAVEVDLALQIEPVDLARDRKGEVPRLPVQLALGLHAPPGVQQRPDRRGQARAGNVVASKDEALSRAVRARAGTRPPAPWRRPPPRRPDRAGSGGDPTRWRSRSAGRRGRSAPRRSETTAPRSDDRTRAAQAAVRGAGGPILRCGAGVPARSSRDRSSGSASRGSVRCE